MSRQSFNKLLLPSFIFALFAFATIIIIATNNEYVTVTDILFPGNSILPQLRANYNSSVVVGATGKRLAVTRTFCKADAAELISSFDVWSELVPCKEKPIIPVDLVLSYSQDLEKSSIAQQAHEAVEQRFYETNGWNGCFDKLVAFGVNIDPRYDIYRPKEQKTNRNWVNGPNRQFERTVRVVSELGDNDYELMYLMEGDSVPIKSHWLDAIISEISNKKPFATLGSSYLGDKWDHFFDQLPSSLIHHTNGNAIYNVTHPLFLNLINEIESESKTSANAVAFDHRIQQIIQEGLIGVASEQYHYHDSEPLRDRTSVFQRWNDLYAAEESIKESNVIGNYAATNMVPELVRDDLFVIHGAKMYNSWDTSAYGEITLVVSDWSEGNSHQLLSTLDDSKHPFHEVIVAQPDGSSSPLVDNYIPTRIHQRGNDPASLDFCNAPVTTEWFVITNSYFRLKPIVCIMVQDKANGHFRPVVSTVEADDATCFAHKSCSQDISIANYFLPGFKQVFQSDNTLFKTSVRDDFCDKLKSLPVSEHLMSTPASAYMAYLENELGGIHTLYKVSDRSRHGSRFTFVPIHEDKLPPIMANQHRRNRQLQNLGSNTTSSCTDFVTEFECTSKGCTWRLDFQSCRDAPLTFDFLDFVEAAKPLVTNDTKTTTTTTTDSTILIKELEKTQTPTSASGTGATTKMSESTTPPTSQTTLQATANKSGVLLRDVSDFVGVNKSNPEVDLNATYYSFFANTSALFANVTGSGNQASNFTNFTNVTVYFKDENTYNAYFGPNGSLVSWRPTQQPSSPPTIQGEKQKNPTQPPTTAPTMQGEPQKNQPGPSTTAPTIQKKPEVEMCTIKVMVSGKHAKSIDIPCPG